MGDPGHEPQDATRRLGHRAALGRTRGEARRLVAFPPLAAWRQTELRHCCETPSGRNEKKERSLNRNTMDFLIWHLLRESARRLPGKEALIHGDQRLSYQDLAGSAERLAAGLREAGLRRGDRIGIYLEPTVDQVLSIFAISQTPSAW